MFRNILEADAETLIYAINTGAVKGIILEWITASKPGLNHLDDKTAGLLEKRWNYVECLQNSPGGLKDYNTERRFP